MKQSIRVETPQGISGILSKEKDDYVFGYGSDAAPSVAISLNMPVRAKQYVQKELHPIFQMNLPEGYMLEELRNRLAKTVKLDPMMLLAIAGAHAPIGRVRIDPQQLLAERQPQPSGKGERLSDILAWDGKENLFEELVNKYIYRAGISGVQPKVLVPHVFEDAPLEPRVTMRTEDLIVKSGRTEYPGLAANEYLCMSIAREAGIPVPEFHLSSNKELFVMKRFDRGPDGEVLGFEDFASLAGLSAEQKYERSYGFIARLVDMYASPQHIQRSREQLFDIVALSCLVGNGDAHLKNFGMLYADPTTEDCRLAPAYDIVNTTAYIPEDILALELKGHKTFFAACEGLKQLGQELGIHDPVDRIQQLMLTTDFVLRKEEEVAHSVPHVVQAIRASLEMYEKAYFDRHTHIQGLIAPKS